MPASEQEGTPPSTSTDTYNLPERGMPMDHVLRFFGEPIKREPAVGEPPITRWHYNNFTVYFENKTVIHAVVNR